MSIRQDLFNIKNSLLREILDKLNFLYFSLILKYFLDVKVGKVFIISNIPFLNIRGKSSNIIIGTNILILGYTDLRNR